MLNNSVFESALEVSVLKIVGILCPVVRQVQEYYAEFCAVNEDFFSANCPDSLQLSLPRPPAPTKMLLARNKNAILTVLLSLKKKPSTIRYAVREASKPRGLGKSVQWACNRKDLLDVAITVIRRNELSCAFNVSTRKVGAGNFTEKLK